MVFSRHRPLAAALHSHLRPSTMSTAVSSSSSVPAARPNPPSPASSRKAVKASASASASSSRPAHRAQDPFYGHEETAVLCARFITSLFQCPNIPTPTHAGAPTPTLAHFVAYALHRTRLPSIVTFAALLLLQRLKTRFPAARGSSGHRLFISAFMIASKVICDDTYSNQSWCIVGQKMFALKEINQMEREMCGYLEWNLNVSGEQLREFESRVRAEHGPRAVTRSPPATAPSEAPASPACVAAVASPATIANAYPSPEATPNHSSAASTASIRPIRPVPPPHKQRSTGSTSAAFNAAVSSFPSPTSIRSAYLHPSDISPQPPVLASASSSLASSPASEDCKTPSPVAHVTKPKRPTNTRTLSGKSVVDLDARSFAPCAASMHLGGQPLSVGGW